MQDQQILKNERDELSQSWPLYRYIQSYVQNYGDQFNCPTSKIHTALNLVNFLQLVTTTNPNFQDHVSVCFSLIYANTVISKFKKAKQPFCHHCLLSTCMLIASKYIDDTGVSLSAWAEVCDMPTSYMVRLEKGVLKGLEYNLFVNWSSFKKFTETYNNDPYVKSMKMQNDQPRLQPQPSPPPPPQQLPLHLLPPQQPQPQQQVRKQQSLPNSHSSGNLTDYSTEFSSNDSLTLHFAAQKPVNFNVYQHQHQHTQANQFQYNMYQIQPPQNNVQQQQYSREPQPHKMALGKSISVSPSHYIRGDYRISNASICSRPGNQGYTVRKSSPKYSPHSCINMLWVQKAGLLSLC
eukprot:Pgem_evm1s1435